MSSPFSEQSTSKQKKIDKLIQKSSISQSGLTLKQIQKERQETVRNIGIEYRYGCYEEKRPDSCQLLGEYFEAVDQNFLAAYNLFRENCEQKHWPRSCYKYGCYFLAGRMVEPSFKKAIPPFKIACDGNVAKACRRLAQIYWFGEHDQEPDSNKAESLMKEACGKEDYEACWILSTWYMGSTTKFAKNKGKLTQLHAKTGSLTKNMNKSLEYGIRACDQGNIMESCFNVSRMYRIGDDIPKDREKAKQYYIRAKDLYLMYKKGFDPGLSA